MTVPSSTLQHDIEQAFDDNTSGNVPASEAKAAFAAAMAAAIQKELKRLIVVLGMFAPAGGYTSASPGSACVPSDDLIALAVEYSSK